MASIQASIELYDRFTPVMTQIMSAMNQTIASAYEMNNAMSNSVNTSSLDAARESITQANAAMQNLNETIDSMASPELNAATQQPQQQQPVQWQSANMPTFTNTGIERFEQEMQSANQMMNQMMRNQNQITQTAASMDILPDNAQSDFLDITQRIQVLQARLQQLNNTPVQLRTDATNNEIEQIRSNISQATQAQNELNNALQNMDVQRANAAYQQLESTISQTERNVRDNTNEQGNFNAAIQTGTQHADKLDQTIRNMVAAYVSIQSVGKVLDVSDELTQTKARIDMMNQSFNQMNGTAMQTDDLVDQIYMSAQNARGSFSDMASVVARFGNNARDAFSSQQEVVDFANLVQKQMRIAGASTDEAANAELQLSQALGSGVLRGDELNSIFEQAPNLIQSIADYMNVPIGQIREMAADGQLSADVVKQAVFASADEVNAKFAAMPMTWGQVWTSFQNTALMAFQPVLDRINQLANNESFQNLVNNVLGGLASIAVGVMNIMGVIGQVATFVSDNWSIIQPIIMGIVGALALYYGTMLIVNTITAIHNGLEAIHAAATMMASGATLAETAAQYGLNAALAACPLTWIILLIIAVIAAIFAVCSAIVKMTGIANTGFGVMTGGISVVIQFFKNLGLSVANIALGIGNALAAVAQNMIIAFQNAVSRVQQFFYSLLSTVASVISRIAEALNQLPFVEFDYSGIQSAANDYASKAAEAAGNIKDYKDIGAAFSEGMGTFDTFQSGWASNAFKAGSAWGDGVSDKVHNMVSGFTDLSKNISVPDASQYQMGTGNGGNYDASKVPSNVADTAKNTAATADALNITDEDLKYLRDIAERDVINRFTTATVNFTQNNSNNISSEMDLDGIIDYASNGLKDALLSVAEGVHA